ncbi:MAG: hypothetical protein ACI352_04745 [Elusimicrobiaceae bacterium]
MKKYLYLLSALALITQLNAAVKTPEGCFASDNQRFTYEKSLSPAEENEQITNCLKTFLSAGYEDYAKQALPILKKSNNLSTAMPETVAIFKSAKDAPSAFASASALISVPEDLGPYKKAVYNVLSSANQEDYKKTLAVIILASAGAVDGGYTPFLTPALSAEDPVLQAYASAAYALIIPETKTRFLNGIITVYGFDKTFALRAFENTGLKNKELNSALKSAVKSEKEITRLSAAEWIGDIQDKKLLEVLLSLPYNDAQTISAAATALAANYDEVSAALKKALRANPETPGAATAVMTYALLGGEYFDEIEKSLQSSNANEQANAARVALSAAEILQSKTPYYQNPFLEEQRIKKLIAPLGKLSNRTKDENAKYYSDAAIKAIYNLINK